MSMLDRAIASLMPHRGAQRAQARLKIAMAERTQHLMNYDATTLGRRGASWKRNNGDADAVAGYGRRQRLASVSLDMIRNTPFATSGQRVIVNAVVADGIIPKLSRDMTGLDDVGAAAARDLNLAGLRIIEDYLDTTAIDRDGRQNLYGLQELALATVITQGEALIVRHIKLGDGKFPLQLQVLEPAFLDDTRDRYMTDGSYIREGIQYDAQGVREGYWLFLDHPGSAWGGSVRSKLLSHFMPASDVIHLYRQDRPGQQRGVSWFAPVALTLQDFDDLQDAQLMRQKIAACFAAFRRQTGDGPKRDGEVPMSISPGAILDVDSDDEITFGTPPGTPDFDPFAKVILRSVAAGLGVTYEALVGDLSGVNFTSGRMGRMSMNANITGWQWKMMIPQMMNPLGEWFRDAWKMTSPEDIPGINQVRIEWVPPHIPLVDPTREIPAMIKAARGGLDSLPNLQRKLGHDPERLREDQREARDWAAVNDMVFDSDAASVSLSGVIQARPSGSAIPEDIDGAYGDEERLSDEE